MGGNAISITYRLLVDWSICALIFPKKIIINIPHFYGVSK